MFHKHWRLLGLSLPKHLPDGSWKMHHDDPVLGKCIMMTQSRALSGGVTIYPYVSERLMKEWQTHCCPLIYLHFSLEHKDGVLWFSTSSPSISEGTDELYSYYKNLAYSHQMISLWWFSWRNLLLNIYTFISFTFLLKAAHRCIIQDDYSWEKKSHLFNTNIEKGISLTLGTLHYSWVHSPQAQCFRAVNGSYRWRADWKLQNSNFHTRLI